MYVCMYFSKIRYKNVEYFNLFWRLPVPNFFLALFISFFLAFYYRYLSAFIILSGCPKKLAVN